ncbi:MAG: CoA transferase [Planctomycetota bacterium]|jgi:crotonobetainyl-CoA:carnitine CoA-transferase CaiB-like acyl-CoA transferase/glyoxylase-like metal-dependent hydrolase (beta-lactamase superfamily II)
MPSPELVPEEVARGVFRIPLAIPFEVGPVNAFVIAGSEPVLLDVGPRTDEAWDALQAGLATVEIPLGSIRHVVISHGHVDHHGNVGRVVEAAANDVRIHIHEQDLANVFHYSETLAATCVHTYPRLTAWGIPKASHGLVQKFQETFRPYGEDVDEAFAAPFSGEVTDLELGDRTLTALHCPGHSKGLCVFRLGDVLFTTDHLLEHITPNPVAYDPPFRGRRTGLPHYVASLTKLRRLSGIRRLLPGHGPAFHGLSRRIEGILTHHEVRLEQITDAVTERPRSVVELVGTLWPGLPQSQYYLACREVEGHLEVLEERGVVRGEADGRGVIRYGRHKQASYAPPTESPAQESEPTAPLAGIRVLDLSRYLPGPFCSQLLGDFGAEIIKVEAPGAGDPVRLAPPFAGEGHSAMFLMVNRNKKSVTLDLKSEAGRKALKRLAMKCDVLLEGFRPGVMERLGLSCEVLRGLNPRLIYCAITGYGQDGPHRDRAGHDLNYMALSGGLDMTGHRSGPPVASGVQVADLSGALYGAIGILLALEARRKTGRGQLVDVSMLDAALSLLSIHAGPALYGKPPRRGEFAISGALPNYGVFETRDGRYLSVGALEPHFWARVCETLGLEQFTGSVIGALTGEPIDPAVLEAVTAKFKEQTLAEWVQAFEGVDACVEPVLAAEEALEHPQVRARGMRRAMAHPTLGLIHQIGPGVKLEETPGTLRLAPPAHGADTEAVLREVAGYSDEELATLTQ